MGVVSQGGGPLRFLWIFHDSLKICLFRHYGHGDNLVCLLSLEKYETTLRIIGPCQKRRALDMFLGRGTSGHPQGSQPNQQLIQLQGLAAKAMALLHLEVNMAQWRNPWDKWYIYLTWIVDFVWFCMVNVGKCTSLMDCLGVVGEKWDKSIGQMFLSPRHWLGEIRWTFPREEINSFCGGVMNSFHLFGESLLNAG